MWQRRSPKAGMTQDVDVVPRLAFDRREFSGALGDLGTDLPLLAGMIVAAGLDGGWTLLAFGAMQVVSALTFGIPMPVQPLKAVAALVIAQRLEPGIVAGGALAIAAIMMLLTVSGALGWMARRVPGAVVRGIQIGLGLKLAQLALGSYMIADGMAGIGLVAGCATLLFLLRRGAFMPPTLAIVLAGTAYAVWRGADLGGGSWSAPWPPSLQIPDAHDIWLGFIVLALPQVPLSLGNSVLATHQLAADWFPRRPVSIRAIGWSYALLNAIAAVTGAVPVCHGSGGMAGHRAFGARTGGSVLVYGLFFILLGCLLASGRDQIASLFPLPALGVILLREAIALVNRVSGLRGNDRAVAGIVAMLAAVLVNGFLIGILAGCLLAWVLPRVTVSETMNSRRNRHAFKMGTAGVAPGALNSRGD